MAECKVPFVTPSTIESLMHQFFPTNAPVKQKKELDEVTDEGLGMMADFGSRHEYSPEEHAATSSERDESPDNVSHSSDHQMQQEREDRKPLLSHTSDFQKQLLLLQGTLEAHTKVKEEDPCTSPSERPGSKIDGLASRLAASSTPMSNPATLFNPQLGSALSALAMQLVGGDGGLSSPASCTPALQCALSQSMPIPAPQPVKTDNTPYTQSPKRKRQRRNPVWPYFIVEDGIAKCKQCAYSTRSVFSTNLKVHLRSHHRADYEKVIEAEDQLNLNALLLSGNAAAGLLGRDAGRKRSLPPMTSSILMTIQKLTAAGQNSALQSALAAAPTCEGIDPMTVLRQTLAASQQLKQANGQNDLLNFQSLANMAFARQQLQQQTLQNASIPRSTPSTPTPQCTPLSTPQPPPTPDGLLSQLNGFSSMHNSGGSPLNLSNSPILSQSNDFHQPKRRRLRRHPVWMFFRDLEERMVGCINCNFRTGSAFSTNLKMHLKAHHKEDYAKVLKLEDEMRIEEGIFGAPNKIKTELIDFIRGGGNASTPVTGPSAGSFPAPSPLVQQLIAGTFSGRTTPQHLPPCPPANLNNNSTGKEEEYSCLSMTDKLAALVGLANGMGEVDEQGDDHSTSTAADTSPSAGTDLLSRFGLLQQMTNPQQLSVSALNAFNSNQGGVPSDSKSCTSSSVDGSSLQFDDRKIERDRAVAKFASAVGESVVHSQHFKEFLRVMVPEYDLPDARSLSAMVSSEDGSSILEGPGVSDETQRHQSESPCGEEQMDEETEMVNPHPIHQLLHNLQNQTNNV